MSKRGSQGKLFRRCPSCFADVGKPGKHDTCSRPDRDASWAFQVELPRGRDGKRRQALKSGFKYRDDAIKAMRELLDAPADPEPAPQPEAAPITFGAYLQEWLAGAKASYAPGAFDAARLHVEKYVLPRPIADVPLAEVTKSQLRALYAELEENGRIRGSQPLSWKTVHNIHRTLSKALNDELDADRPRITGNPAARAHPARRDEEIDTEAAPMAWTVEQLQRFLALTEDDRLGVVWRVAAATGMRRGELAGLRWANVDLDNGVIRADEQRAKGGGTVSLRTTKNRRRRTIALDPRTVEALRVWQERQMLEEAAWRGSWGNSEGFVFTDARGRAYYPDSLTKAFKRRVEKAGLPWIRLHGMRHTMASLWLDAGELAQVVQERLGHSSISITFDVYGHPDKRLQAEAAARMAERMTEQHKNP
jgi:integrase